MTNKEKLVELLETIPYAQRLYPDLYVDMLIENGITIPVRCKDCKHMEKVGLNNHRYCNVWRHINGMGDDGYCNYGERKDNVRITD